MSSPSHPQCSWYFPFCTDIVFTLGAEHDGMDTSVSCPAASWPNGHWHRTSLFVKKERPTCLSSCSYAGYRLSLQSTVRQASWLSGLQEPHGAPAHALTSLRASAAVLSRCAPEQQILLPALTLSDSVAPNSSSVTHFFTYCSMSHMYIVTHFFPYCGIYPASLCFHLDLKYNIRNDT